MPDITALLDNLVMVSERPLGKIRHEFECAILRPDMGQIDEQATLGFANFRDGGPTHFRFPAR